MGICGTLMGSIATLAKAAGYAVSGSDENIYPPMSDQLSAAGIDIRSPYAPEHIPNEIDLVIIGNANLPRGTPVVEYVLAKRIPYTSGAEWLGRYLLPEKWVIAVAGTHGKTTTISMIAWILEFAGLSPGFLVGGVPSNFPTSARLGDSPLFVIEADEYDTSYFDRKSKFLHYRPNTVVLNNLEFDHADIFPNLEAIKNQFHLLMRTIPQNGLIIRLAQDVNLADVIRRGCWSEQTTFSSMAAGGLIEAATRKPDASQFTVFEADKSIGEVSWGMSGQHHLMNALAAILAAKHAGVPPSIACEVLGYFKGVKRRLEVIYQTPWLTVYDDFAHHPTAIKSTLDGLRQKVGGESILVIIELGSHTMKKGVYQDQLQNAVNAANQVIWFKPANLCWDMEAAVSSHKSLVIADIDSLVTMSHRLLNRQALQHCVIMGNSGFGGLHGKLVARLTATDTNVSSNNA